MTREQLLNLVLQLLVYGSDLLQEGPDLHEARNDRVLLY